MIDDLTTHTDSGRQEMIHPYKTLYGRDLLKQWEADNMLNRRLVPQTTYRMRLSQFTSKQCHKLDVVTLKTFLPLMVINRSTPRALVHGPIQYGGMDIMKHEALQDEWGMHFFWTFIT